MIQTRLDNDFALATPIKLKEENGKDVFDGLEISHSHCEAIISLYGGQVLSFRPSGHKDVLWLSKQANYQPGKAIRGGIPLCWPWFGVNNKQTSQYVSGNHGFARQLSWEIESIKANERGVTLILVLTGDNQHPLWPNAYKLTQTLFFGRSFKQTLAMTNLGKEDIQYSAALHNYFTVSNPNNVSIDDLTGVHYSDKLTGKSSIQQQSVSCVGEIDREYHCSEKMTIVDKVWQRKIDIVSSNCQQWVLWNPGIELANSMVDIHPQGEQEYICLEAANTTWQSLLVGKTVTMSQEIKVTQC